MKNKRKRRCIICGKLFAGYGNNPAPFRDHGRACDRCNDKIIAERLRLALADARINQDLGALQNDNRK